MQGEQLATLVLGACGEVNTADDPPMTIGVLPPEQLQGLKPGDPVRCAVTGLTVPTPGNMYAQQTATICP